MKLRSRITLALIGSALTLALGACGTMEEHKQQKLLSQAQISRTDAENTALAKVPGTIKKGELEKEKGKLMWSFDVIPTGSKETTEVEVDAKTGEIIAVENEAGEKNEKK